MSTIKNKLKKFVDTQITDFLKGGAKLLLIAEYHNDVQIENARKRICMGSEKHEIPTCMYYIPNRDQCGVCKCIVDVKAKTLTNYTLTGDVEITHCPKGFWEDSELVKKE